MVEEIKKALKISQKWNSPRIDNVPNLWLNAFNSILRNILIAPSKIQRQIQTGLRNVLRTATQSE